MINNITAIFIKIFILNKKPIVKNITLFKCIKYCCCIFVIGIISLIVGISNKPFEFRWNHVRKGTILYNIPFIKDTAKPRPNNIINGLIGSSKKAKLNLFISAL